MMVRVAKSQNILFTPPLNKTHEMNRNFMLSFEDDNENTF